MLSIFDFLVNYLSLLHVPHSRLHNGSLPMQKIVYPIEGLVKVDANLRIEWDKITSEGKQTKSINAGRSVLLPIVFGSNLFPPMV